MNVYIVIGSEDGYCGAFGSKKRAIEYGDKYIAAGGGDTGYEMSEYDHGIYMYGNNGTNVEITKDKVQ
jgi:hypothetical protein